MFQPGVVQHTGSLSVPLAEPYPWFAVRVKPNFEKTSTASLASRGFEHFLPTYKQERKWTDRTKSIEFPLFPGYLFCRFDPQVRTPVLSTPGVIGIVSSGTTILPISDEEIESVRRVTRERIPAEPWPYLTAGRRVRVSRGALTGVEGIVIEARGAFRLVLQVTLLQRSIGMEIDRDCITPVN